MSPPSPLFWRSLAAFLALPGVVALLVPWLLARGMPDGFSAAGVPPLVVGLALLLWCVRDFHVAGHGTLAPWAPPRRLVVVGLYRHTRNPMYVAVTLVLLGWALGARTTSLWAYALGVAVAFHLRVVLGEEPWLARTHSDDWTRYAARVPRWLPSPFRWRAGGGRSDEGERG